MARRRRTFDSRLCSSVSFSTVLICFQERTSCVFSNFAQSSWRRFTDTSGVSLLGSDADLLRTPSLTPSASVGSASEPSDLHSNEESLDLVAGDSSVSQIWLAQFPTSAFLMFLPSSAAAAPAWCFSRNFFHSQAAGQNLGFQVLGQSWVSQIMGLLLDLDLLGLMDEKPMFASPQLNVANSFSPCRFRLWSPLATFIGLDSHLIAFQEVFSATPFNWWISPMSLSFHLRVMSRQDMETAKSSLLFWRLFVEHLLLLGAFELPRYQISSCRGQREIACPPPRYQNSSCRGQREIACPLPRYQNSSCRGQREIDCFRHLRAPLLLPSFSSSRRAVVAGDSAQLSLPYPKSFMERSLSLFSSFMERTLSLPSSFMERTLSLLSSFMERTIPLNFSFLESVAKSSASMASRAQSTVRLPSLAEELLKTIFNSIKSEAFSMESTRDFITLPIYPYVYAYASLIHFVVSENFRASNSLAKSLLMTCIVTPG